MVTAVHHACVSGLGRVVSHVTSCIRKRPPLPTARVSRHFLKAAAAANKANKATAKAADKAAPQPKKPRSLTALEKLQVEEREQLEREFELLLGPLEACVSAIQAEFVSTLLKDGNDSQPTKDVAARLEAAAKEVQEMKDKKKVLLAEQRATHVAQMGAMKAPTPLQAAAKAQLRAAAMPAAVPAAAAPATTPTAAPATAAPTTPTVQAAYPGLGAAVAR
eukprot:scaffold134125_cov99-Phaeocystis_antarctica.AAC.1